MRDYFVHPEWKAATPHGIGTLDRRQIVAVDHVYIGKETNEVREEEQAESNGAVTYSDAEQYAQYGLCEAVWVYGAKALNQAAREKGLTPISGRTLYRVAKGKATDPDTIRLFIDVLNVAAPAQGCCQSNGAFHGLDIGANFSDLTASTSADRNTNTLIGVHWRHQSVTAFRRTTAYMFKPSDVIDE